jgi:hypothetical protein
MRVVLVVMMCFLSMRLLRRALGFMAHAHGIG